MDISSVEKPWCCWVLSFVCLFVVVFVFHRATQRKCVAIQILPVGCQFVVSDLVQLLRATGQDAKGQNDICVYGASDSVGGLKPGLRVFSLFLLLFYCVVPLLSFSDHFLLSIEGKKYPSI